MKCPHWMYLRPNIGSVSSLDVFAHNQLRFRKRNRTARRKGAASPYDLLLVPEVADVVSDYSMYFGSKTHPRNPQIDDENKSGEARKSKKAAVKNSDPSPAEWRDIMRFLACGNPYSEEAFGARLQMVGDLDD